MDLPLAFFFVSVTLAKEDAKHTIRKKILEDTPKCLSEAEPKFVRFH